MKPILYLAIVLLLLGSCSRSYNDYLLDSQGEQIESISSCGDSLLYIEYAFIGSTNNYFLFECYIENQSSDTIDIDHTLIQMDVLDEKVFTAFSRQELVKRLKSEQQELKKTKKKRTIANIALTGLEILASVASGGSAESSIIYGAESTLYIFDDRRFLQRGIKSVDDEIEYIMDLGFAQESIPPNSTLTRDVFFPLQIVSSDVGIVLSKDRHEFVCYFDQELFNIER